MRKLKKVKSKFSILEDNGGGLHLAVFEGSQCVAFFSGFEFNDGSLVDSINALDEGFGGWDGDAEEPQVEYDNMTNHQYGWALVADNDGIYPNRMGAAARREFDIELDGLHSQAKKLKGIFTYNAGVYDNPLQAHAEGGLHCIDGATDCNTIARIDSAMNCANKALTYAGSSFTAVYVVGQLWTADIDGAHLNGNEFDLEKHLAEKAIRGTLFIAPHYNMLRPDVWHHLRDILPSMFDLLSDNKKLDNSMALDVYDHIQDATSALAGFSVPSDRSLALELFVNEWAPAEK